MGDPAPWAVPVPTLVRCPPAPFASSVVPMSSTAIRRLRAAGLLIGVMLAFSASPAVAQTHAQTHAQSA